MNKNENTTYQDLWEAATVQECSFCITRLEERKCHAFPIGGYKRKLRESAKMLDVGQDGRRSQ